MKKTLIAIALTAGATFTAMAQDIVDTAVKAGNFKTLVAAVQAAGLVDTLKGPGPFTVFAPTDEAFAKIPKATMAQAAAVPELAAYAAQLGDALQQVGAATQAAWATGNPAEALANAVPYMQAFGHTVLAWVWLDVALATLRADATLSIAASAGRMGAARYFYHYELPKIGAWLNVVNSRDTTCAALSEAAF